MAKAPRYYEKNETETYGMIPNAGEYVALIQIYYGFDYEPGLPMELLRQVCLKEFNVLPQYPSPTPLDGNKDNKIRINISVNQNMIPNYGIKEEGKTDRNGTLPPLV